MGFVFFSDYLSPKIDCWRSNGNTIQNIQSGKTSSMILKFGVNWNFTILNIRERSLLVKSMDSWVKQSGLKFHLSHFLAVKLSHLFNFSVPHFLPPQQDIIIVPISRVLVKTE